MLATPIPPDKPDRSSDESTLTEDKQPTFRTEADLAVTHDIGTLHDISAGEVRSTLEASRIGAAIHNELLTAFLRDPLEFITPEEIARGLQREGIQAAAKDVLDTLMISGKMTFPTGLYAERDVRRGKEANYYAFRLANREWSADTLRKRERSSRPLVPAARPF